MSKLSKEKNEYLICSFGLFLEDQDEDEFIDTLHHILAKQFSSSSNGAKIDHNVKIRHKTPTKEESGYRVTRDIEIEDPLIRSSPFSQEIPRNSSGN